MRILFRTKLALYAVAAGLGLLVWPGPIAGQQPAEPAQTTPANQSLAPAVAAADLKPAPPTPIAEKKVELGLPSWDPEWDKTIEEAIPREFLDSNRVAKDVKPFCPRYRSLTNADKRAYWAYFFQALAGAEAGLEPTADVRHTQPEVAVVDTVSHRMVRAEGLLQLTYMDSDRYGCDFDWEKDKNLSHKDPDKTILQPSNNLLCGIKILNNQLINLKRPLLSKKSYWSTLQPGTTGYKVFRREMANVPAVCRTAEPLQGGSLAEGNLLLQQNSGQVLKNAIR